MAISKKISLSPWIGTPNALIALATSSILFKQCNAAFKKDESFKLIRPPALVYPINGKNIRDIHPLESDYQDHFHEDLLKKLCSCLVLRLFYLQQIPLEIKPYPKVNKTNRKHFCNSYL